MEFLFGIGLVLVILLGVGAAWLVDKQRTKALAQTATEMNFTFTERDDALVNGVYGLPLLLEGDSRRARNIMQGDSEGTKLTLFDYQYTTGSGRHRNVHVQTVILFKNA